MKEEIFIDNSRDMINVIKTMGLMKKIFLAMLLQVVLANSLMAQGEESGIDTMATSPSSLSGQIATKAQGDEAYAAGDFQKAITVYETLLHTNGEAAGVYYNLGNSYYKDGQLARAILNYERALLMEPGDDDIRFNLEMARSKTVDKITPLSELFFIRWAKDFTALLGSDAWAVCGVVAFMCLLLGLALYLFVARMAVRKTGFFVALAGLLVCVVANCAAAYRKELRQQGISAIVMTPTVTVKSTPAESGTDLFVIHEGLKVEIKDDSMNQWKEIRLADGNVGWVPVESIEKI